MVRFNELFNPSFGLVSDLSFKSMKVFSHSRSARWLEEHDKIPSRQTERTVAIKKGQGKVVYL